MNYWHRCGKLSLTLAACTAQHIASGGRWFSAASRTVVGGDRWLMSTRRILRVERLWWRSSHVRMATNGGHGGGRHFFKQLGSSFDDQLQLRLVKRPSFTSPHENFNCLCDVLDPFTVVGQHQRIHRIAISVLNVPNVRFITILAANFSVIYCRFKSVFKLLLECL